MSIYTILDRFDFLRGEPAAWLVVIAAAVAIAAWDMRLVLPALGVHYLASFLLYADVLDPRLAIVYALAGVVVTLIMTVTAAQVNWGRPPALSATDRSPVDIESSLVLGPLRLTTQQVTRLILVLVVVGAVFALNRAGLLPQPEGLPPHIVLAVAGLVGVGLVGVVTGGPLYAGVGLLVFLNGFDLFNSSVEQSIALVVALTAVNLLAALVVAYLAQARFLPVDFVE